MRGSSASTRPGYNGATGLGTRLKNKRMSARWYMLVWRLLHENEAIYAMSGS